MGFAGVVCFFDVEVVAVGLNLLDGDSPSLRRFDAVGEKTRVMRCCCDFSIALLLRLLAKPSGFFSVEFFDADGFRFVVGFGSRWIRVFVVPDFFRRLAFREEQQVRLDAGAAGRVEDYFAELPVDHIPTRSLQCRHHVFGADITFAERFLFIK